PDGQVLVSVAGTDTRNASNGLPDDPKRLGGPSEQAATTQEQWPAPDELDRKLRRSFLDFLGGMDEATLAQYLATPEGQRAQALQSEGQRHPRPRPGAGKPGAARTQVGAAGRAGRAVADAQPAVGARLGIVQLGCQPRRSGE